MLLCTADSPTTLPSNCGTYTCTCDEEGYYASTDGKVINILVTLPGDSYSNVAVYSSPVLAVPIPALATRV